MNLNIQLIEDANEQNYCSICSNDFNHNNIIVCHTHHHKIINNICFHCDNLGITYLYTILCPMHSLTHCHKCTNLSNNNICEECDILIYN